MTQTTPTPGQPLSEADVSLLQPGDLCLRIHAPILVEWIEQGEGRPCWFRDVATGKEWGGLPEAFTYLGRPDQDGWIEGPMPVGVSVEVDPSSQVARRNNIEPRWRPHAPVSRPGDGVEGGRDEVRLAVVKAIAFIKRDLDTPRINDTVASLLPDLIRADEILRKEA